MKQLSVKKVLVILLILHIIDGDLWSFSALNIIKSVLLVVCFILCFRKGDVEL